MRWDCMGCGVATIRTRMIDGAFLTVDADPTGAADGVVLKGDLNDDPTSFWNTPAEGDSFWNIPADAPRYSRHQCKRS